MSKAQRPGEDDYAATRLVPLTSLRPAAWNPRYIRDARFKALCAALAHDPQFLWDRPILARPNGEIFAGNMRWRAAQHLGWTEIPARTVDIPEAQAKERALRDNNEYGEWAEDALGELLVELKDLDIDIGTLGFPDEDLERLLDLTGALGDIPEVTAPPSLDTLPQWHECPRCGHRWVEED